MVIPNIKKKIPELININNDNMQAKNESMSTLMEAMGGCGVASLMGEEGCSE